MRRASSFIVSYVPMIIVGHASLAAAQVSGDPVIDGQPVLSAHDHWAWILLLVILLGLFLPAAIVGPLLRRRAAVELPELHTGQEIDSHTATRAGPRYAELKEAPHVNAGLPV